jgi:hypothetical protein
VEQDVLLAFLTDECVQAPEAKVPAATLYQKYREWGETGNEFVLSQRKFSEAMTEKGFTRARETYQKKQQWVWTGVGILANGPLPEPPSRRNDEKEKVTSSPVTPDTGGAGDDDSACQLDALDVKNDLRPYMSPSWGENLEIASNASNASSYVYKDTLNAMPTDGNTAKQADVSLPKDRDEVPIPGFDEDETPTAARRKAQQMGIRMVLNPPRPQPTEPPRRPWDPAWDDIRNLRQRLLCMAKALGYPAMAVDGYQIPAGKKGWNTACFETKVAVVAEIYDAVRAQFES